MNESRQLLPVLLQQEEELQFTEFSNETALRLGLYFAELGKREGKAITIDITRNGQQLFHYALPGTCADNDAWIERKRRVVLRYGHSSFYVGNLFRAEGASFEENSRLDRDLYAAHGGCFPILIRGVGAVGTVTVSGLPQFEDHELVVRVLRAFLLEPGSTLA